ncbi:hypothetical protein JB92DRAFT_695921 [Gautieria morchelliformis]|nr:hypothetical protein JB92DRAFT_695921 [Gautieria morchelliformis]
MNLRLWIDRLCIKLRAFSFGARRQANNTSSLEVNATTTAILRTTMNNLPLELVEAIIGHVDEKDDISRSHLLACSLVCRLWLPSSQRLLFHHIKFGHELQAQFRRAVQRLDHVLLNSPHLASYIRVLDLPILWRCRSFSYYEHRIVIDKLSSLLPKLTQVQKLNISGVFWNALPGDFRQSLCRVLELPSMVSVCISHAQFNCMDDIINFINHARSLTGLTLAGLYPFQTDTSRMSRNPVALEDTQANDNMKQRFKRRRISHLTRLDMMFGSNNSVLINWLLGPRSHLGVSHIHTLHIRLPNTSADDSVNQLLCAIGSSLKHAFFSMPRNFRRPINLAFNVNIEILSLVHTGMDSNILSTLRRALSTIDVSNHIHHMELRVDPICRDNLVDWAVWEEVYSIYSILVGPHFQFLQVLFINIGPGCFCWNNLGDNVEKSKDMAASHALLATRGRRVSFGLPISCFRCIFCHNPWPSTALVSQMHTQISVRRQ